jgi:serine/threonine protein phosphatase PrpC
MPTADQRFVGQDLDAPVTLGLPEGRAVVFTHRAPEKTGPNEDAALVLSLDGDRALLALLDGMGGQVAGERASAAAAEALARSVPAAVAEGRTFREAILTGCESANAAVLDLKLGAGATLALVEIVGRSVRAYHVGDSEVLVVGQRGRRKLQTVSHSPVGYAVEAGLLDEREALDHEDRHLVSNALGGSDMRVEMSARVALARHDTVLVASDGLFDNLHTQELVDGIRKGPLEDAAARLVREAQRRMTHPRDGKPSKPDDLTFILFRPAKPHPAPHEAPGAAAPEGPARASQ